MKFNRNNILTAIFILAILIIGYVWYSYWSARPTAPISASPVSGDLTGRQFLAILGTLESTKIDTSFFDNPLFQNLQDTLTLEEVGIPTDLGRSNPFLPLR